MAKKKGWSGSPKHSATSGPVMTGGGPRTMTPGPGKFFGGVKPESNAISKRAVSKGPKMG